MKGITQTMHVLPLQNADYWLDPRVKTIQFSRNIARANKEALTIDCPDHIPTIIKSTFPVVMIGAREEAVPYKNVFKGKTIGICTNLETGRSFIGSVHRSPDVISDKAPSPGLIVEDYLIDLRKFLAIPWETATYKIWFIYYELLSNGITCRLTTDEDTFGSDKETEYLNYITHHAPRRTVRIDTMFSYTSNAEVPSTELTVAITPKTTEQTEATLTISGKLPILPHQKVSPEEQIGNLANVHAVIPLDIVLLRTHGAWQQLSMGVPCYTELQNADGKSIAVFETHINLAHFQLIDIPADEKMFVYAFSGQYAAGPGFIEMPMLKQ